MGLDRGELEWRQQSEQRPGYPSWVARVAKPFDTNPARTKYLRYAQINMLPWHAPHKKGKHVVELLDTEILWFDSIEAAKLHVEAVFALDND